MNNDVIKYALDVINKKRIACKSVIKACANFLSDLVKSKKKEIEYMFIPYLAEEAISFCEKLPFPTGVLKGERIKLADFQKFIIGNLYGWVIREQYEKGRRVLRYRKAYIQLARKNAKSFLATFILLLSACYYNSQSDENYIGSASAKQSGNVFNTIAKFIDSSFLKDDVDRRDNTKHQITFKNGNFITSLSSDTSKFDGFLPAGAVVDELHCHPRDNNGGQVSLFEQGQTSIENAITFVITTAGFNKNSYCYEEYKMCKKDLDKRQFDRYFIFIAEQDEEDDILKCDLETFYKSNPLAYYNPLILDSLEEMRKEIISNENKIPGFKIKSMNMWIDNIMQKFLSEDIVNETSRKTDMEDFRGCTARVGIDLSKGGDLSAIVFLFEKIENGVKHYYAFQHSFMSKDKITDNVLKGNIPYDLFERQGLLTIIDEDKFMDYQFILEYLEEAILDYELDISYLAYDPAYATMLINKICDADFLDEETEIVTVTQNPRSLNEPVLYLRNLFSKAKNIHISEDDKLFYTCLLNAEIIINVKGQEFTTISKGSNQYQKIDCCAALVNIIKTICNERIEEEFVFNISDGYD